MTQFYHRFKASLQILPTKFVSQIKHMGFRREDGVIDADPIITAANNAEARTIVI